MEKIPTAEEFLPETQIWDLTTKEKEVVYNSLRDFAKLHVKAALKAAAENAEFGTVDSAEEYLECKESILNAYPENLIK